MCGRGPEVERDTAAEVRADSAQNDLTDRKRTQALLSAQNRSLEMIAAGASLADVLEVLCEAIDAQGPEIISSILLLDPTTKQLSLAGLGAPGIACRMSPVAFRSLQ